MKYTISKTEYEQLEEVIQKQYDAKGDEYQIQLEGVEDTGALKRAKEHEKERRHKAEQELKEVRDKLDSKEQEIMDLRKGAVSKDDVEALEKSYKEKLEDTQKDYEDRLNTSENSLKNLLVDNVANKLATEISTVPDLMANAIATRLTTEVVDGKTITRVLDNEGKPSALTVDELKKEFIANEKFSSIIVGSNASGSGAQGSGNGGGAAKKFSEMSESERIDLYKSSPDDYRTLRDSETTAPAAG